MCVSPVTDTHIFPPRVTLKPQPPRAPLWKTKDLNLSATRRECAWPFKRVWRAVFFFLINELKEHTQQRHEETDSTQRRSITNKRLVSLLYPHRLRSYMPPVTLRRPSFLIAVCSDPSSYCLLTLACPHLHLSALEEIHLMGLCCKTTLSL